MKKILALILCFAIAAATAVPAFATEETAINPVVTEEGTVEMPGEEEVEGGEENGDMSEEETHEPEDIPLTEEELEELRKELALEAFDPVLATATEGFLGLAMFPLIPVMLIVPVFGWMTSFISLISPFVIIALPFMFVSAGFEAIDIYVNFDPSEYQTATA